MCINTSEYCSNLKYTVCNKSINIVYILSPSSRLKACKEERDRFETQLTAEERSNTSLDAQRKSALADKNRLQKEVSLVLYKPNGNVQCSHIVYVHANVLPYKLLTTVAV